MTPAHLPGDALGRPCPHCHGELRQGRTSDLGIVETTLEREATHAPDCPAAASLAASHRRLTRYARTLLLASLPVVAAPTCQDLSSAASAPTANGLDNGTVGWTELPVDGPTGLAARELDDAA